MWHTQPVRDTCTLPFSLYTLIYFHCLLLYSTWAAPSPHTPVSFSYLSLFSVPHLHPSQLPPSDLYDTRCHLPMFCAGWWRQRWQPGAVCVSSVLLFLYGVEVVVMGVVVSWCFWCWWLSRGLTWWWSDVMLLISVLLRWFKVNSRFLICVLFVLKILSRRTHFSCSEVSLLARHNT